MAGNKLLVGMGTLCVLTSAALGDIQVVQKSTEYKVVVGQLTVGDTASLVLAWDAEDRGETLSDWPNTRVLTTELGPVGGDFRTPIEGVPEGSVVRAFAKQTYRFFEDDGYVELSGNQYFQTDIKENEASGMEMAFVMMGGGNWCPLIAGSHDRFTIGRRNNANNQVFVRCHNGDEIGAYPTFTANARTVLSLRRGGEEGKWGVLSVDGAEIHRKEYGEAFVLYKDAASPIHLGTSVNRVNFTNCKWFSVKLWDLEETLVREYVPAQCVESGRGLLYEKFTKTLVASQGTGSSTASGTPAASWDMLLAVSPPATAVDPLMVAIANWTGLARNGRPDDPGNWACTNLLDEVVENGLPGSNAVVNVLGEIDLQLAAGMAITGRTVTLNARLTADTDWSGHFLTELGTDVLQPGAYLEMNGHGLTLAGDYLATPNQWTVQNSAAGDPATLSFVTAAEHEYANRVTWLKGNLRLEKQGAGTYVAHTQTGNDGSDFTGGAYLLDGLTRLVDGTWWRVFGGDAKVVHIGANATFDTWGTYHVCNTPIFLEGGTILQSRSMTNQDQNSFGNITLTADSTFRATANTVINTRSDLNSEIMMAKFDLGGKTLTFDMDEVYLDLGKVEMTNGQVKVVGNCMFRTDGAGYHALTAPSVDFDIEAKWIELYSNVAMHDFTCRSKSSPGHGNPDKDLLVYGTFRPVTPHFPKVTLMDGAGLSLVDQSGTWSARSACESKPQYRTIFPEVGTITVDVTGRTDLLELGNSEFPYLVTWIEGEEPTGVDFQLVGAKQGFTVRPDLTGLRLDTPKFIIVVR